jgi:hypothetical protein
LQSKNWKYCEVGREKYFYVTQQLNNLYIFLIKSLKKKCISIYLMDILGLLSVYVLAHLVLFFRSTSHLPYWLGNGIDYTPKI